MTQTITVTPSWQIHLPVEFRNKLGLKEPGMMELSLKEDKLILVPKKSSILKMAGKYKNRKPKVKINIDNIREKIDYSKL